MPFSQTSDRPTSRLSWLKRWGDAQECAWLFPWSPCATPRERMVRELRIQALRLIRKQNREKVSLPIIFTRTLIWPVVLFFRSWQEAGRVSSEGFWPRFAQGCMDLIQYNLRPGAMNAIREQRPHSPELTKLYIPDRECQALHIHLTQHARHSRLANKIEFTRFCSHHQLAHILPIAHSGMDCNDRFSWPQTDLFVKAANLWGGQKTHALRYLSREQRWQNQDGEQISAAQLRSWIEHQYGEHPWLVQPMLQVDRKWSQWSPGPLGTIRIVTVIVNRGSAPRIVAASMRLPRADMIVDNFSSGALSAELNEETGELGPALGHPQFQRWNDIHPDTRGQITGARIPDWDAYRALAIKAHAAAPDLLTVGWDLSCCHGEPTLIEANPVYNLAPTVVLGETCWLEAMWSASSETQYLNSDVI